MAYVLPFVLSMAVAMSLLPMLVRVAGRLSIVDQPGDRKVHLTAIPRVGGIAMAVGVLASVSSLMPALMGPELGFLAGATILVAFGVADDRYNLDFRLKLLGQVLAVCLPVFLGGIHIDSVTLTDRIAVPPAVGVSLTLLYLVGVTNAVNLTDGLDGLAGGTAFLCLCAIAWLAHVAGQGAVLTLALAFAGAVIGFLRFNTHPAVVFMGDAGSQLLGFAIGVLSLMATQSVDTPISTALPILLLGTPILDTLQVIIRRLAAGKSPFAADRRHIHHRLLALGFGHHEAVMVLYGLQAAFFLLAYTLRFESDLVILGAYLTVVVLALGGIEAAMRAGWQARAADRPARSAPAAITRIVARFYEGGELLRLSIGLIVVVLLSYAVVVIVRTEALPIDIRFAVWLLLGAALLALAVRRNRDVSTVEKAIWYLTVASLVYGDTVAGPMDRAVPTLDWALVLGLALLTVLALKASRARTFEVTPLDLIILFVAVVAPNLPGLQALPPIATLGVAKVVVGLYALEVVMTARSLRPLWLRTAGALVLALMAAGFPIAIR